MPTAPSNDFAVFLDWSDTWERGREFTTTDIATGLRLCTWPDYLHVRELSNGVRYVVRRVRASGRRAEYQRLESLEGYVWLEPTYNGHLRRVYAPLRYVVSDKSSDGSVYHVTRNGDHALCGWSFNGARVLSEPPAGMRECRNCAANTWRCVP